MNLPKFNRRSFLRRSGIAAAGAAAAGGAYWLMREPIRVGLIGTGVRGQYLARHLQHKRRHPVYGDVVAICDVDRAHAEKARALYAPRADLYEDYRRVVERDDIQAVFVATPDHWHAAISLAAIRAGKAVYCEKPMTLTIDEGRLLVQAVRQTGAIFQVGTQQRSTSQFQLACELVRNGHLGRLKRVTVSVGPGAKGGPFPSRPVPKELNWDLWLGQAPWAEYCPERCHDTFRGWYEYAGGEITNWGVHQIDIVHWALGVDDAGPVSVEGFAEIPRIQNGFTAPSECTVDMLYPNDVHVRIETRKDNSDILFEGDRGRILVSRSRIAGKPVEELKRHPLPADAVRCRNSRTYLGIDCGLTVHIRDFFDCVLTGKQPISDVVSQHRSATACHLANISMRLGRKLIWDPVREEVVRDPEANGMLVRPQRTEYSLPMPETIAQYPPRTFKS